MSDEATNKQMYVEINGSKVPYDGSAEDTKLAGWQMEYIDLPFFQGYTHFHGC